MHNENAQDGLLGIALDPDLLKNKGRNYVYVSLTYAAGGGDGHPNRTAIRRYTYDPLTRKLHSPVDILKGLPSSREHQAGRLLFGPDGKLYYSIGDQGHNQLEYLCEPNMAQVIPTAVEIEAGDWSHYAGKILRLNTDGSIPNDNPLVGGVRSHIYATGFRNPQGLAFSPLGKLFQSEQGPNTDDEINIILPGGNYGWPHIAGYKDGNGYAYANYSEASGGCEKVQDPAQNGLKVPKGVPVQNEFEWSSPDFIAPLKTLFSVDNSYDFNNPVCAENGLFYMCWPTIAPSSATYYKGGEAGIPGWKDSLLITSLKRGVIYRVKLDATQSVPLGDAQPILRSTNRYRDVVVSPDGGTLYVITDASIGMVQSNTGSATNEFENPGSLIKFDYVDSK